MCNRVAQILAAIEARVERALRELFDPLWARILSFGRSVRGARLSIAISLVALFVSVGALGIAALHRVALVKMSAVTSGGVGWISWIQSGGVIASLIFAGLAMLMNIRTQRLTNLLKLTSAHREIWSTLLHRSEVRRVLCEKPDLGDLPITEDERLFVTFIILHINVCVKFSNSRMVTSIEQMRLDIGELFSLPIPNQIWNSIRRYQDRDVVSFIDECISGSAGGQRT